MKKTVMLLITLLLIACVLFEPNGYFIGLLFIWMILQLTRYLNRYIVAHEFYVEIVGDNRLNCDEKTLLQMTISHKGNLPIFYAELQIQVENKLTNEKMTYSMPISIARNDEQNIKFELQLDHCGNWEIQVLAVNMSKLIMPSKISFEVTAIHNVIVFPKIFAMDIQLSEDGEQQHHLNKQRYSTTNQSSERFGFRAYRKGDSIKAIHWKLSAKQDELVVSEHIEEQQTTAHFYIEKANQPEKYDALLSLLFSLLLACQKTNKQGLIRIGGDDYAISNVEEIAVALLSGQRCELPQIKDFIAIVADEEVKSSRVFQLKAENIKRLRPTDFTVESMQKQFAYVTL